MYPNCWHSLHVLLPCACKGMYREHTAAEAPIGTNACSKEVKIEDDMPMQFRPEGAEEDPFLLTSTLLCLCNSGTASGQLSSLQTAMQSNPRHIQRLLRLRLRKNANLAGLQVCKSVVLICCTWKAVVMDRNESTAWYTCLSSFPDDSHVCLTTNLQQYTDSCQ